MARWNELENRKAMLSAAAEWRERCFFGDGSMSSERAVWTLENVRGLKKRVVDAPIWDNDRGFDDKLIEQLHGAEPDVVRLAAEIMWFVFLLPRRTFIKDKFDRINGIMNLAYLSWLPNGFLDDDVLGGMSSEGVAYNTFRYEGLAFLLRLLEGWKTKGEAERQAFHAPNTAWSLAEWCDGFLDTNKDGGKERTPLRHALLYWLYPDSFERVVSAGHKENIIRDFLLKLSADSQAEYQALSTRKPLLVLDRYIFEIRQALEAEYGSADLDFYCPPLDILWSRGKESKAGTPLENALLKSKATEGEVYEARRKVRRRLSQRGKKIKRFRKLNGDRLFCEVCGSEGRSYPESLRERVFEIHHIDHLADASGPIDTGLDDLAVLCANCHRAIHAGDPPPTIDGLRDAIGHMTAIHGEE